MDFYAYLLRCSDGSYYAGHTDDIDLRIGQHQSGALGGYTAKRRPVQLVWSDRFATRDEAFAVERKLKVDAISRLGQVTLSIRLRILSPQEARSHRRDAHCPDHPFSPSS